MDVANIENKSLQQSEQVKLCETITHRVTDLLDNKKWFRLFLAGVSGLLLLISFPPFSYGLFCWVALVPLLLAISSAPSQRNAGICGLVTGIVFYSVSLSFLIDDAGFLGLILANLLTVYIAIFAVSFWLIAKRIGLARSLLLTPLFWTGIEYFRSEVYVFKFPWLSLGYSQSKLYYLIQVCDIIGVYGLSFLIMTVNVLIAWFILERIRKQKWNSLYPIASLILIVIIFIYGLTREQYQPKYRRPYSTQTISVAVVQGWIGSLDNYIKETMESVDSTRPTLVVWPESSVEKVLSDLSKRNMIEALARDKKLYIVLGTYEPTEEVIKYHNLVVIFSPEGRLIGQYAKRVPVPLIESVITPGDKWGIFDTSLGKIGVLICYEAGFSNIAAWLAHKREIELFVIPTLEVGRWGGLANQHHASMMPFRAIETRRPILRSSALGVSMIIHPTGKIEGQLDYLASGVLRSEIIKRTDLTFYVEYGYIFPRLCFGAYLLFLVIVIFLYVVIRTPGAKQIYELLKIEKIITLLHKEI